GAEFLRGDGRGVGVRDQLAVVDDAEGVGQADQLVEVGRDQQDGQSLAAGLADVVPDRGLRADVHTAGGVGGDQEARLVAHLAADDQLLLVAAGQGGRGDVDARGADVVRLDDAAGVLLGGLGVQPDALGVGLLGDVAEDAVLPEGGLQEQAVAVAVLGDVADALLAAPAGAPGGDLLVGEPDDAGVGGPQADQRVDEFGLAVALHAGDAQDLTLVDGEGDVVEQGLAARGGQAERVDGDDGTVGDRRLALLRAGQLAADHHLGEL